jgi:glycosyltransferase involved in cell wall biosynthesis
MNISGFSFVKNAIKFDYPVVESITSILPVCDEFIIAIGDSEDDTLNLIKSIPSDKIKIIQTVWDKTLTKGGEVLSQQTNIALNHCTGDWCFYIQADEVVHEKYLSVIKESMENFLNDKKVQGILFNYTHFYGNYKYYGVSRRWYRREVRIIRNDIGVTSYKDAQGFRIKNKKLRVKLIDAYIYHYGWVKDPKIMMDKQRFFHTLWHSKEFVQKKFGTLQKYDYSNINELKLFGDSHPKVMNERTKNEKSEFLYAPLKNPKLSFKQKLLEYIEKKFGKRIGEYKGYIILKDNHSA